MVCIVYTGNLWRRGELDPMDLRFCCIEGGDLYISDSKYKRFGYRGSECDSRLNLFFYISFRGDIGENCSRTRGMRLMPLEFRLNRGTAIYKAGKCVNQVL